MFGYKRNVCFFDNMTLDLSKELPELRNDIYEISRKNSYIVDVEFNVISLYQEYDSKLSVIKIITGKDRRVKKVTRLVFEGTKATPVEQYEMIGVDGTLPIRKEVILRPERKLLQVKERTRGNL